MKQDNTANIHMTKIALKDNRLDQSKIQRQGGQLAVYLARITEKDPNWIPVYELGLTMDRVLQQYKLMEEALTTHLDFMQPQPKEKEKK